VPPALSRSAALAFAIRAIQSIVTGVNEAKLPRNFAVFGVFHQPFTNFIGIFCVWRTLTWISRFCSALVCIGIWFLPQSHVRDEDAEAA
jgi:hypothetical protein